MDISNKVFTAPIGIQTLTRGTRVIEKENWYQVISPHNKTPSANEIIHSALSEREAHKAIEEAISFDTFFKEWWLDKEPSITERLNLKEDLLWSLKHRQAQYVLAKVDGEPAGTAGLFPKKNSVYFVGDNVLKKFRGRGIYRGLLAERFRQTKDLGYELAVTGARERTSAPILEKLGWQTAFRDRVYQWSGTLPE